MEFFASALPGSVHLGAREARPAGHAAIRWEAPAATARANTAPSSATRRVVPARSLAHANIVGSLQYHASQRQLL
jgi:hypothetical protein